MFVGISYNATAQLRNEDCNESPDWWDCDPDHSFDMEEAVITGNGGGGGGGGGWSEDPPPSFPPPPPIGGGGGGNNNNNTPSTSTVTVTASPQIGGSVSGGGVYNDGAQCTIAATPANGFNFTGWTGSVSSTYNPHSFVVPGNCNIRAIFMPATYSPCGQSNSLDDNSDISKTLDTLKTYAANNDFERAGYMSMGANGEPLYKAGNGPPITGGTYTMPMALDYGYLFVWGFHSHPSGTIYMFSFGDIYAIYEFFSQQRIYDFSTFAYGIVNDLGEAYAIMISDMGQFIAFISMNELHDINSQWYNNLSDALQNAGENAQLAEQKFVDALSNSGLSIMKAGTISPISTTWERIEYNTATEQVETKPCN
jgi:hypothetical protein